MSYHASFVSSNIIIKLLTLRNWVGYKYPINGADMTESSGLPELDK